MTGAVDGPSGFRTGVGAVVDGGRAIHDDVAHARGVLVRLLEGGPIGDRGGVEDNDIRQ